MLEESVLVISVEGENQEFAKVRAERQSACGSCSLKQGCGQSTLAKLSGGKCVELTVPNSLQARPGDMVQLDIPNQSLLTASLLVYMLPLALMITFAVLAEKVLGWPDLAVAITGLFALAVSFYSVHRYSLRCAVDERFLPQMIRFVAKNRAINADSTI